MQDDGRLKLMLVLFVALILATRLYAVLISSAPLMKNRKSAGLQFRELAAEFLVAPQKRAGSGLASGYLLDAMASSWSVFLLVAATPNSTPDDSDDPVNPPAIRGQRSGSGLEAAVLFSPQDAISNSTTASNSTTTINSSSSIPTTSTTIVSTTTTSTAQTTTTANMTTSSTTTSLPTTTSLTNTTTSTITSIPTSTTPLTTSSTTTSTSTTSSTTSSTVNTTSIQEVNSTTNAIATNGIQPAEDAAQVGPAGNPTNATANQTASQTSNYVNVTIPSKVVGFNTINLGGRGRAHIAVGPGSALSYLNVTLKGVPKPGKFNINVANNTSLTFPTGTLPPADKRVYQYIQINESIYNSTNSVDPYISNVTYGFQVSSGWMGLHGSCRRT